jgi:hypothetical protein
MAVAITVVIVPALPPMPEFDPLSLRGLLLCAEQIIVGALFGLSLQLLFQAFVIAGQIVAVQMGMAFASMVDPANGVNVTVIGQFLTMLVSVLFLLMNGHLVVFEVLTESFTTLPVGSALVVNHFWEWPGAWAGCSVPAAADSAGDHRVAGGQHRLWRDDPRGAAVEHLLHRFPADPGAGHVHLLGRPGRHSSHYQAWPRDAAVAA